MNTGKHIEGYVVYLLTNKVNGKEYVGMTKNFRRRMQGHKTVSRRKPGSAIHAAIRKYGADSFDARVLGVYPDRQTCIDAEVAEIAARGTQQNGYNITAGGDGLRALTAEAMTRLRASLSKALRGVPKSPSHAEAVRKSLTGVKKSEAHKAALKAAFVGRTCSAAAKAKMSAQRKGKLLSKEHAAAISAALKGRTYSPDTIEAMRASAIRARGRRVRCATTGQVFDCLVLAAEWCKEEGSAKASPAAIGRACRGLVPRAYGHFWSYED